MRYAVYHMQHMICCISASLHSPVADFIVRNPDSGEYPRRTTLMLVTEYLCWDLCRECSKMGMLVTKTTKTIIYIPKSQIVTNISNFLLTVSSNRHQHRCSCLQFHFHKTNYINIFLGIADQKKENEDFSYDDIDWDTLPEEINHTRSHVQSLLGNRFGRRQSLDDSVVGIKVNNSRRRRGALDALGLISHITQPI